MLEWLISASWKVASPLQIPQWDLLQIGYAQLQLGSISWGNEGVQSVLVQISVCGKRASGFWVLPAFCVVC